MRLTSRGVRVSAVCLAALLACLGGRARAGDWPTWRHDPARSAVTDEELPGELHLQWVRHYPALEPAWPDQNRLRFDVAYEPIVKGKTLFVASSRSDRVTALETETGAEKWRFYADGPVRFAPLAWRNRLFFANDDGHLYCLRASDGKLLWRFRGAPSEGRLLGNKRLISTWPVRGAPVVADGVVYFGAGIWPMMGTFLYALDAETGEVVWRNEAAALLFIDQPHSSPAFSGVSPQGYLAAVGDRLLVPNGRAVPACFDRTTGELQYFHLAENAKNGAFAIASAGEFFFNGGKFFDLATGGGGRSIHDNWLPYDDTVTPVMTPETGYALIDGAVCGFSLAMREQYNRRGEPWVGPAMDLVWFTVAGSRVHCRAGSRLYTSGKDMVFAVDIPSRGEGANISWRGEVSGTPESVVAADGKLFVSTREGALYCFGPEERSPRAYPSEETSAPAADAWTAKARDILEHTDVREGYCLAFGVGSGRLVEELARQSSLHVIGIDPDTHKVARLRRKLDVAGLYGERVALLPGDPLKVALPPYLAGLVVSEDLKAGGVDAPGTFARRVFDSLRPYGGVACLEVPAEEHASFAQALGAAHLPSAVVGRSGSFTTLARTGPLEGSADWTHQYADASNTVVSKDRLVRAPLGVLWFGGTTHFSVLPRHGHGPSEHVVDGRLFIEGPNTIRATDIYTGRPLWEVQLPGLGLPYDNTQHQPGANALGSNYASAHDGIYVLWGHKCLRLDPASGKTLGEFTVELDTQAQEEALFGFVAVSGDLLVTGVTPMTFDWDPNFRWEDFRRHEREGRLGSIFNIVNGWKGDPYVERKDARSDLAFLARNLNEILNEPDLTARVPDNVMASHGETTDVSLLRKEIRTYLEDVGTSEQYDTTLRSLNRRLLQHLYPILPKRRRGEVGYFNWDHTSSRQVVVMNRYTGEVLWRRAAAQGFRHNAICVGDGKVFCIDRLPDSERRIMQRRGLPEEANPRIIAFDLATGKPVWETTDEVFGTWLAYSAEHDVLLEAGRASRDMLFYEPRRKMAAWRGKDGKLLWRKENYHLGPCMLHGERIITSSDAYSLLTGEEVNWDHPLTGEAIEWRYRRMYGCGTPVGSQHLLTFRSAAAGFYDLERMGGTGNFGGFRSGCTSNLIAAGGVLSAPDYTRTCTCSYQNQTSLALVHMRDVEMWTFNVFGTGRRRIRRLGLNLGAPGDRRTDDGTLWLEYPLVGGPSPPVRVATVPGDAQCFYRHSSRITDGEMKWVSASGAKGLSELKVTLAPEGRTLPWMFLRKVALPYTVRLYFAEPDGLGVGERVFDVAVQGETLLKGFDVVRQAGGANRTVVREFRGIRAAEQLSIALSRADGSRGKTLLCGVEIIAEGW